jgi:hypothetical protein
MPLKIPPPSAGNPIWLNDNIWLDVQGGPQNTGEAEGTPPLQPGGLFGTRDNLIGVHVERDEGGVDPNVVRMQAFVSNPSVGVGVSNGNLVSGGGANGLQSSLPANTDFATQQTVHMDWYPTDAEVAVNGGHICIAANVYDTGGDGAPLTAGAFTLSDQHMAQRNIHLIIGPARLTEALLLPLSFYVPEAELLPADAKEVLVRVDSVDKELVLTSVIREQLLATDLVTLVGGKPTPEADVPGVCLSEPRERIRLRGGGELVLADQEAPIHPSKHRPPKVVLGDYERPDGREASLQVSPRRGRPTPVTARFEFVPDKDPGGVHEFDIVCEAGDGELAGGLRVVLVSQAHDRDYGGR